MNNEQENIFSHLYRTFKFTKPIRSIELFAGYGAQAMALERLQEEKLLSFERYKVVEFDKFAINSYNKVHNTNFPILDIRDIHAANLEITNKEEYHYVLFYSYPCQDVSIAGKQKGMKKGSNTRSSLLWEVERILGECWKDKCLPDILVMENVPNVIGSKNYPVFMKWYATLEALGYQSYYKIVNASDFGIPQSRDRMFMMSILGDYQYSFPDGFPLVKHLKDVLETDVDEKYYLSDNFLRCVTDMTNRNGFIRGKRFKVLDKESDLANTITTSPGNRVTDNFILDPKEIVIPEATKKGYALAREGDYINLSYSESKTRRGRVGKQKAQTLLCNDNNGVVVERQNNLEIRKLTPRECGRLMDVRDEDIDMILAINSNRQAYKQFGNSIVVSVLYYILKQFCE